MTTRWRLLPVAVVMLVALPWAITPFMSGAAEKSSSNAARLIEQMREAPLTYDFDGVVELTWRDGKKIKRATVNVKSVNGTIEVASGSGKVVDYGATAYVLGDAGWTSVGVLPTPANLPSADHAWTLTARPGEEIAGRPTTTIVASRDATGAVQKLSLDTKTNLLLARVVRDANGQVQRSLQFTSLTFGVGPSLAKSGTSSSSATKDVPDPYRAPHEPGGGYVLVATARGQGKVQLSYSDGLFTISVHEQRGTLDWDALPAGGTSLQIAGHQARRWVEPGDDVIVWESDGVVYTCVTDAPADVIDTMIAGLSPSGRSTVEKAVDFVLGPFGWH